ncbi:hypothetical protein DSH55_12195, partial [Enterococcus faecalis]|nr:hypothetical protein [Enterococcus faecalis]
MNIHKEVSNYLKFIVKNYEYTTLAKIIKKNDNDLNNMFPVLVEFIQVLWALELYEEHENISSEVKNFLTKIRIVYLRLLYVYPLNDDFIVEAILRQISENVLKTLFLIETPGKNIEEVTKMSYRALWDTN